MLLCVARNFLNFRKIMTTPTISLTDSNIATVNSSTKISTDLSKNGNSVSTSAQSIGSTKTLKVLTLNAWSIDLVWPIGSKDRLIRIPAIADALAEGDWDIVALQEIWGVDDYDLIKRRVASVLPGTHYFHSGFTGSGVCVFTKGTIYSTSMHRYSLNGYPHHVHRGEWFAGKVVGLARINLNGLKIDLYATHLHAEYDRIRDLYLSHRVLQAFELSQFINDTSIGDVTIVMGDLNLEPTDLGYKLIVSRAHLSDAYTSRVEKGTDQMDGATCYVPSNCYTEQFDIAKRIDYILYRSNEKYRVVSQQCQLALGRIEAEPSLNYSDHEAVSATLKVMARGNHAPPTTADDGNILDQAIELMQLGIKTSARNHVWFVWALVVLFVLYYCTILIEMTYGNRIITITALLSRFWLTLAIGFCFIYGFIGLRLEQKALEAAKSSMLILKKNA